MTEDLPAPGALECADVTTPDAPTPDTVVAFAVYDPDSGLIRRVGACPRSALSAQAGPSEEVLEIATPVDDTAWHVKDGALHPLPPSPGDGWEWSRAASAWTIDPKAAAAALAAARADALREITTMIDTAADRITGTVPLVERISWGTKEIAARAVIAGTPSPEEAAMIAGEASVTGEDVAALATRIQANADTWRLIAARMAAHRRRAAAALAVADDSAAVAAVFADLASALDRIAQSGDPDTIPKEAPDAA